MKNALLAALAVASLAGSARAIRCTEENPRCLDPRTRGRASEPAVSCDAAALRTELQTRRAANCGLSAAAEGAVVEVRCLPYETATFDASALGCSREDVAAALLEVNGSQAAVDEAAEDAREGYVESAGNRFRHTVDCVMGRLPAEQCDQ